MVKNIFRLFIFMLVATAALVIITPVLSVNNFLYPVRIDSAYVSQQQLAYEKKTKAGTADTLINFIYSPDQLEINYIDVSLTMTDSVVLRGWMSIDTTRLQSPLLLIIPDIYEGSINYIPAIKQFCDRGFNVCVMDMRGQGNSEGEFYNPGEKAAKDIVVIIHELKKMPFIDQVAVMGTGTGAGIALKAAADSSVADVVVLQNLPVSLRRFFTRQAINEWGNLIQPILPAVTRSYERKTGIQFSKFRFNEIVKSLSIPQLYVTANFKSKIEIDESVSNYNASAYLKKKLFIDSNTYLKPTGLGNDKNYYDKISTFINSSLPQKTKKTRFRKLAFQLPPN